MIKKIVFILLMPFLGFSQEMWFETQFENTNNWITSGFNNLIYSAPPEPFAWKADISSNSIASQLNLVGNAREGNYAISIVINSNNYRNEIGAQSDVNVTPARFGLEFGQEYWLGYSMKIVDLANEGGWNIMGQMRGYSNDEANAIGKTNFFTLQANTSGGLIFGFSTDPAEVNNTPSGCAICSQKMYNTYIDGSPIQYAIGQWFDIVLHFKLEWDNTGYLEAWHNGKKFVDIPAGPTVYRYDAAGLEVKRWMTRTIGIYTGGGGIGEVHYDAYRLWKGPGTYETVSPLGLSPGAGGGTPPIIPSVGLGKQKTQSSLLISH